MKTPETYYYPEDEIASIHQTIAYFFTYISRVCDEIIGNGKSITSIGEELDQTMHNNQFVIPFPEVEISPLDSKPYLTISNAHSPTYDEKEKLERHMRQIITSCTNGSLDLRQIETLTSLIAGTKHLKVSEERIKALLEKLRQKTIASNFTRLYLLATPIDNIVYFGNVTQLDTFVSMINSALIDSVLLLDGIDLEGIKSELIIRLNTDANKKQWFDNLLKQIISFYVQITLQKELKDQTQSHQFEADLLRVLKEYKFAKNIGIKAIQLIDDESY